MDWWTNIHSPQRLTPTFRAKTFNICFSWKQTSEVKRSYPGEAILSRLTHLCHGAPSSSEAIKVALSHDGGWHVPATHSHSQPPPTKAQFTPVWADLLTTRKMQSNARFILSAPGRYPALPPQPTLVWTENHKSLESALRDARLFLCPYDVTFKTDLRPHTAIYAHTHITKRCPWIRLCVSVVTKQRVCIGSSAQREWCIGAVTQPKEFIALKNKRKKKTSSNSVPGCPDVSLTRLAPSSQTCVDSGPLPVSRCSSPIR